MNSLDEIAVGRTADKGSVFHNYCVRYSQYMDKWREQQIRLLEIGVQFGCSAGMWLEAFPNANIYGVDIVNCHTDAKLDQNPRWSFFMGDQRDRNFWEGFKSRVPPLTVIIDDGCHHADAIRISLECLWPHLVNGGVYIIEDVHCLWDKEFSSPVQASDLVRWLFEDVNWHGKSYHGKPNPEPYTLTYFEKTVDFVHLYKGLIVIGKAS